MTGLVFKMPDGLTWNIILCRLGERDLIKNNVTNYFEGVENHLEHMHCVQM